MLILIVQPEKEKKASQTGDNKAENTQPSPQPVDSAQAPPAAQQLPAQQAFNPQFPMFPFMGQPFNPNIMFR